MADDENGFLASAIALVKFLFGRSYLSRARDNFRVSEDARKRRWGERERE